MRGMKKSWKILTTLGSKIWWQRLRGRWQWRETENLTTQGSSSGRGGWRGGGQCSEKVGMKLFWFLQTSDAQGIEIWWQWWQGRKNYEKLKTWRHKGVWLSDGSFDQRINAISSPTLIMEPIRSIAGDQGPFQKLSRVDIVSSWSFTSWESGTKRTCKIGRP